MFCSSPSPAPKRDPSEPPNPLSCTPLSVGDASNLLCGAAKEDEGEGKDQAEQHAEDTHGTALLQGHLEPLQDGTADHDANHRPRDVHRTWGKADPTAWCLTSKPMGFVVMVAMGWGRTWRPGGSFATFMIP